MTLIKQNFLKLNTHPLPTQAGAVMVAAKFNPHHLAEAALGRRPLALGAEPEDGTAQSANEGNTASPHPPTALPQLSSEASLVQALASSAWPGGEPLHVLKRCAAAVIVEYGQRTKMGWVISGQVVGERMGGPTSTE
jgi:hypothetical protein